MCSSSASGGLIFVAALVGAVAYGDGFDLHLVYSPAATDGAGHGGADIDDAAAVEWAAVAHAHVATLAGLETGDAHHTGQGQGAVCRVFAALGQAFAHAPMEPPSLYTEASPVSLYCRAVAISIGR